VEQLQTQAQSFFGSLSTNGETDDAGSSESNGLSLSAERVSGAIQQLANSLQGLIGYLVLITALFVLGIVEVPRWRHKLRERFSDPLPAKTLDTAAAVTEQVQRFLLVQSFTSVLTGILTGAFCWIFGVDFAFLWGFLALVLNFIPTLGSMVAIVPPTLFALLQLGWQPPVVFAGLAAIQLVLGSYIDPKLQGRYLELSAFVILVAITFWGWIWGIPGAFIAVPITAALVLIAEHTDGADWVPRLLTRDGSDTHSLPSRPPEPDSTSDSGSASATENA
jgi:predicted PurR-regulated permease PerM